ncbi:hypothetical protein [Pararhodonellum marinum]|uniref:hypothetical protein n=1 Tax=Pararhodonellum marinum TaxID=2755358 RepID=UPI00188F4FB9|nr:hypothetical protein [Pararhodonellum marinum]
MEKLLTAKHWQIFILLIFGLFVGGSRVENEPTINAILTTAGNLIYGIYPLAIGHFLQDYLPKKIELNYNFFLINFFIWITVSSAIMILSDGEGMTFNGLLAIPFFYVFYAFLYSIAFPAKTLKSIELGKKASFAEYFADFFLIFFLPIGIWFLQPRINRVIKSGQLANKESRTAKTVL